ncbi:MAG: hypothetical protein SVW77_01875 [Candidatus Nanohaloarchaea archaeon]|nr:hypothetical protein [Candidatus Nanohaloarchaea archaeon]
MSKTAMDILADEAVWAVDTVLDGTVEHFSENLGSLPLPGMGLKFVQRSAEKQLMRRIENDLLPVIEAHMEVQLAAVEALADGKDREAVREEYGEELLDTNPLWGPLSGEDVRDALVSEDLDACETAAAWIQEAGNQEFESFGNLTQELGRSPEEAVDEIRPLLEYLPDLLDRYRDDLDLGVYSPVLASRAVRNWFVDTFIDGLQQSQAEALEEIGQRVREEYADA